MGTLADQLIRQGQQEGKQQGLEQGRFDAKRSIAQALLDRNTALDLVSQVTGLSIEELAKLTQQKADKD